MSIDEVKIGLKKIVHDLVDGRINDVYLHDIEQRITPKEIGDALKKYDTNLSIPPESAFDNMSVYEFEDKSGILVEFNLWFDNEESDLTLIVVFYRNGGYVIEDIRVL